MSNYTKSTDFSAKDALLTGDPLKIVKGTEIDDEFNAIQTAVNSKAELAGSSAQNFSANTLTVTNSLSVDSYTVTGYGNVIAWGRMDGTDGSLVDGYGWTGERTTTGTYTITLDSPQPNANYAATASSETNVGVEIDSFTTDDFRFRNRGANEVLQDSTIRFIVVA